MAELDKCKESLEKLDKEVKQLREFIDDVGSEYSFFIKHIGDIKEVFNMLEKEFSEVKSCPVPAVKVDGECKDTSLLLEPVVGRYVPSEDIFYEIKTLVDAGALGKLKDKVSELESYIDSIAGGYTCPIPETTSEEEMKTPMLMKKVEDKNKEDKDEDLYDKMPLDVVADAEAAITEAKYMKLAKKKPRNETSKRRQWYKECMAEKLSHKPGKMTRAEWRDFFKKAAQECKGENPYPKKGGD